MKIIFASADIKEEYRLLPLADITLEHMQHATSYLYAIAVANSVMIKKDGNCKWLKNKYGPVGIHPCDNEPIYDTPIYE